MLEEVAVVESFKDGVAALSTRIKTTCNQCEQQSHCGTGLISRYLAPKPENLVLPCPFDVQEGQQVKIAVAEKAMLTLAFFIYMMPILTLAVSAVVLTLAFPHISEGLLVGLSALATGAYFILLKHIIARMGWHRFEPRIVGVIEMPVEISVQNLP